MSIYRSRRRKAKEYVRRLRANLSMQLFAKRFGDVENHGSKPKPHKNHNKMLRLLIDENFNNHILRGVKLRLPQLDFVLARHVGLARLPDTVLLRWAAQENRTILTQDIKTMIPDAIRFIVQGEPMAGVILVPQRLNMGLAISDLELLLESFSQPELRDSIRYLPL